MVKMNRPFKNWAYMTSFQMVAEYWTIPLHDKNIPFENETSLVFGQSL
jgi:hypothetical protein